MTWRIIKSNIKFVMKSKPVVTSILVGIGVLIGLFAGQLF